MRATEYSVSLYATYIAIRSIYKSSQSRERLPMNARDEA